MILTLPADEIRFSLRGALKIFTDDPQALSYFNMSSTGFWHSFQAFWIVLVPYMFAVLAERAELLDEHELTLAAFPSALFFTIKIVRIIIEWLAIPIILWLAADILDIKARFQAFIIVRNWASVVITWIVFVPTLTYMAGLISLDVMIFAQLILLGFVLYFSYKIARTTLEKPFGFCLALIAVDFIAGLIITRSLWTVFEAHLVGIASI